MGTQNQESTGKQCRWVAAFAILAVATLIPINAAWSTNTDAPFSVDLEATSNLDASAHAVEEATNGWSSFPDAPWCEADHDYSVWGCSEPDLLTR
jgi:hypothetical protein